MLALLATGAQAAPKAAEVQAMMKGSFTDKGIAKAERVEQDALQAACSATKPPTTEQAAKLQAEQLASVKWPSDGKYLGDWKEGEKLAQNGKGMTWSDKADAPSGGNCYNCHQISKKEISFGTIGPSLYQYGKLRGVADPAAAASEAVVKYTWGKIYNAKAYNACSGMPRFGHAGVLTEGQMRDIMALLLDPKSPVNE
ncbi:MAG TPA: sulfur oxidation c-type cytochrome SoxX [Burkholderiaceae bacterium]